MEGQLHQYKVYGTYREYSTSGGLSGKGSGSTKVEAPDERSAEKLARQQFGAGDEFTPTSVEHICCS